MRRIVFVINNRANYARIKTTIREACRRNDLDVKIVVGASGILYRFGNVSDIIKKDGFIINERMYTVVEGDEPVTMVKTTALSLLSLADIFYRLNPDIVLTVADRYETIATAIASSYMNIPLAHTQGGEITGSIDDSVRHAISKLAHLHFPATKKAAWVLERLGEDPKDIFWVGCPSVDLANEAEYEPMQKIVSRYSGVGSELDFSKPFVLVSQHSDTLDYESARHQVEQTLDAIKKINIQTVWLWPNVDSGSDSISKRLREFKEQEPEFKIHFYRNFQPNDYINVLRHAKCIIGNSSSGIREAGFLGRPAVNIGGRQEGREKGVNVLDVSYDYLQIAEAITTQINRGSFESDFTYGKGNAGRMMADILATHDLSLKKKKLKFET